METINRVPKSPDRNNDEEALRSGISKDRAGEMGIGILDEDFPKTKTPTEQGSPIQEVSEVKEEKVKSLRDKILGIFGQAPEQLTEKYKKLGEERMQTNPALMQAYDKYLTEESADVAEAYKEAIGKWKYIARDEKGNFVDKTVYSVASGEAMRDN